MAEYLVAVILPWIVWVCLLILLLLFISYLPKLLQSFWKLSWKTKICFVIILSTGIYVRFWVVPNTHRIYYDEDRYLSYAVTFAKYGQARSVKFADSKTLIGDPDQAVRITVPVLHALVFKSFGFKESNIFIAAKILSSLQIIFVFILAYILFQSKSVALFSALGISLLPNVVFWSTSASLDPYFVTFALINCISVILYARKPSLMTRLFLFTSMFTLLCVRLEAFLFIFFAMGIYYNLRKEQKNTLFVRDELVFYILLVSAICIRALASISVLNKQWCCAEGLPIEAFHIKYFMRNILPNFLQLFDRPEFPAFISVFAIITPIRKFSFKTTILGVWIFTYFVLYSFYYAGMFYSPEFSGSYGRYFLILTPPILMLAGITLTSILTYILSRSVIKRIIYIVFISSLFIVFIFPIVQNYRTLITISPYYKWVDSGPAYLHDFQENYFIANTPKNSMVLTTLSSLALLSDRSTALFSLFIDDPDIQHKVIQHLKDGDRVFSTLATQCDDTPQNCEPIDLLVKFKPVTSINPHSSGVSLVEILLRKKG